MASTPSRGAKNDLYEAWMQREHSTQFSGWDRYSTAKLIRFCDQFNECQLFREIARNPTSRTLSDIGCATGRFYRYFRKVSPSLDYKGFDISPVAIDHAKSLYHQADFRVFDGNLKSDAEIKSDLIFCRDVVLHQPDPREFLSDLYDVTGSHAILRLRTREMGATVFDVSQSCQYSTSGRWVPYIVFNTTELVDLIRSFRPSPAKIVLRRHPVVLGGYNRRYLPKELYYPETGTAETALLIEKGSDDSDKEPSVTIETCPETRQQPRWTRLVRHIGRRWGL